MWLFHVWVRLSSRDSYDARDQYRHNIPSSIYSKYQIAFRKRWQIFFFALSSQYFPFRCPPLSDRCLTKTFILCLTRAAGARRRQWRVVVRGRLSSISFVNKGMRHYEYRCVLHRCVLWRCSKSSKKEKKSTPTPWRYFVHSRKTARTIIPSFQV